MTDDSQTAAEKRNSVALAATLFRDDTAESDIFGSLDEHTNEDQPYPVTRDPVDSIFGSSETSTARSDAEDFFSDVDKTSSSWANYSEVSTENDPTAYFAALTDEPWPNDATASGTQVQSYSRNDEQWQTSSHAAHAHERGYGSPPSLGSPSHEMTVSQQSQPSNPTASSYQEMNTMPNRPSGAVYDSGGPHSQTSRSFYTPAASAPSSNTYNPYAPPIDAYYAVSDPRRNDLYAPPAPSTSGYATTQTYTSTLYQTSTQYHTSYAPADGNSHLYSTSSPYGSSGKAPLPTAVTAPPPTTVDARKFRTSSFDAYDPPTIPTRKSAFRGPPPPTSSQFNKPAASYDHTMQHPVALEPRRVSPPSPPPPAHPPVANWTHTASPSEAVPPPPHSSRTSNLPPAAPPSHAPPPSVPLPDMAPRDILPSRAPSSPPPPASINGVLAPDYGVQASAVNGATHGVQLPPPQSPPINVSEVENWPPDVVAPEEPTVVPTYSNQRASDSHVLKPSFVSDAQAGIPDDEDLGLANPSGQTPQWDVEGPNVNSATDTAASIDYIVPYPPVTDQHNNEEDVREAGKGGRDHDIEGNSASTFDASALGNETRSGGIAHLSGSSVGGGNHEVPPFGLPDATAVALSSCVSRAGAETTPSISNDPYVPSVAASGPPRVTQRVPSPPKRTISDSPSPYIPSVYSSNTNAGRYAPPPPPAQKPSLNIDPPTSGSYSHYQPPTETFVPPRHEPSSLAPPPPSSAYSSSPSQPSIYSLPVPQASASHEVSPIQRSVYAPSPSQSAADDPRTTTRIPIFNFGFGGKVVTCFQSRTDMNAGFDIALAGRPSDIISIRSVKSIAAESVFEPSLAEFPGPLFTGNILPTIGLGRATGTQSSAVKTKKAAILKYINERADELERGLGYLSSTKDEAERRSTEGRVVLLRLLIVMIDNDGKLSGTPELAEQVRSAILPVNGVPFSKSSASSSPTAAAGFSAPATEAFNETREQPLAVYQVRASSLDRLQSLLLSGKRREACHYALDQKLWAHAMIISSSMEKEMWKDVVNEFIRTELGVQMNTPTTLAPRHELVPVPALQETTNGRESLRVLYSLFSGQGTAAVQEMLPPKNLSKASESTHFAPPTIQPSPISPNFPKPALTTHIQAEVLSKWPETAASIVSNINNAGEHYAALTTLGDYLISNKWVEAAHACYLLSVQTSPLGGVGAPSVRLTLIGSDSPSVRRNFHLDIDAVRYTEVVEFALSLLPPAKEPFGGLMHLQPYKLLRAWQLAELGLVKEATKYCEAIAAILKANPRGSPFFTMTFLELHQELSNRLAGTADKNSSWISRTIKTPSMDSLGSWSLNKLTKFIEGDEPSPIAEEAPSNERSIIGPFSHYSEISSATTSQLPSPNGSVKGVSLADGGPPPGPPRRSGSATGSRAPVAPPTDRSASAMGYVRPMRTSPSGSGRHWSAGPSTTTFDSTGPNVFTPQLDKTSSYSSGWWNSANGNASGGAADTDTGATPTATIFQPNGSADEGNFMSIMDSYTPAHTPTLAPAPASTAYSSRNTVQEEEEEDLGLGNTLHKRNKQADAASVTNAAEEVVEKDDAKKEKEKPSSLALAAASKGWFSSWWGSKGDKPKPIRANLGETKSSFYYDKELKRWVNGKESAPATPTTAPPPPPSRAQTASPSNMGSASTPNVPPSPNSSTPPPRAQSSMGLTTGPPRSTPLSSFRVPSGLSTSFVPPAPGESGGVTPSSPAPPRAKSAQGQRRNARARYVDVFANPSS